MSFIEFLVFMVAGMLIGLICGMSVMKFFWSENKSRSRLGRWIAAAITVLFTTQQ